MQKYNELNKNLSDLIGKFESISIFYNDCLDIIINGKTYIGDSKIMGLKLKNPYINRTFYMGFMYTTSNPEAWMQFINKNSILLSRKIDDEILDWTSIS